MNIDKLIVNFDYLSITFDISQSHREGVLQKLRDLSKQDKADNRLKFDCLPHYLKKKSRYRFHFKIFIRPTSKNPIGSLASYRGVSFVLSLDPIDKNQEPRAGRKKQYYAKITFNPNKARFTGALKIFRFLRTLIDSENAKKIYESGRITRTDMCVDLHRQPSIILPYASKMKKYKIYKTEQGVITGMSLGSDNSEDKINIYDKKEEGRAKGKKPSTYDIHWRLELRRRDLRCSPSSFSADPLKKKLSTVEFFDKTIFEDASINELFKDMVIAGGVNHALNHCDKKVRRKLLRKLREKHSLNHPFDIEGINVEQFSLLLSAFKMKS